MIIFEKIIAPPAPLRTNILQDFCDNKVEQSDVILLLNPELLKEINLKVFMNFRWDRFFIVTSFLFLIQVKTIFLKIIATSLFFWFNTYKRVKKWI